MLKQDPLSWLKKAPKTENLQAILDQGNSVPDSSISKGMKRIMDKKIWESSKDDLDALSLMSVNIEKDIKGKTKDEIKTSQSFKTIRNAIEEIKKNLK